MILVKIILLVILSLAFIIMAFTNKYKVLNKVLILFFFVITAIFIIFPQQSDIVASILGISTGANLAVYLSVSILFLVVSSLYAKQKRQERMITRLVRKRALDSFSKND